MNPDAIVVFSAGIMPLGEGRYRVTTYDESDMFGTLGGKDRIQASAALALRYPNATLVTTSRQMSGEEPTLAAVYAAELITSGVSSARIIKEEQSVSTHTAVTEVIRLAHLHDWKRLMLVSSGYHLPRIKAFVESANLNLEVTYVASETVLQEHDPSFASKFLDIQKRPQYLSRLEAEARGIAAIKAGEYVSASVEDKKERPV